VTDDSEALRAQVAGILRSLLADAVAGKISPETATRLGADRVLERVSGAAAHRSPTNSEQLAMLDTLTRRHGCHAASILARRLAMDPGDPREIHRLMQHFRRLRRRRKKNAQGCVSSPDAA